MAHYRSGYAGVSDSAEQKAMTVPDLVEGLLRAGS